jgi:hypothetical protein
VGAMAIADLVKSTLGPKGMDKILQSMGRGERVSVTNDGATILKSIYVDNPAAKVGDCPSYLTVHRCFPQHVAISLSGDVQGETHPSLHC